MKELGGGIIALIGALLVSTLMYSIGVLYSFGYSLFMTVTGKNWKLFFIFWWRLVDGWCAALGYLLYQIGFALDLGWNVNGEIIEDLITAKENTTLSQKNITVSASVGKLEVEGDLNKFGHGFSKVLSIAFGQKQHAVDAWRWTNARNELQKQYFEKR